MRMNQPTVYAKKQLFLLYFMRLYILIFGISAFVLFACKQKEREKQGGKLFSLLSPKETGIDFTNTIVDDETFNIFSYRNFYNGGGVAIGDVNNDSLPDVFFTANMGANKLFLNKGNLTFQDVSDSAGIAERQSWSTGVVMVDINADGWLDIYVCNAGYKKGINTKNSLYINNQDGTFTESAKSYGLDNDGYTTHAAFFDYDLDGDLDCYILNNSFIPVNTLNNSNNRDLRAKDWPVADFLKGGGSYLMENVNGKYVDVSEKAGIYGSLISFGLGITVGDVNGDLYPDIYVSNDFYERDYLYINQKNGTFSESLESYMGHISQSSMGADLADINNDGYPDFFVTDMLPDTDERLKRTTSFETFDTYNLKVRQGFFHQYMQNTLQLNNRNGKFLEIAHYAGVSASDWSWGGLFFDADNDGFNDIYVCNGISRDLTDQDFIDFFADDVIQRAALTGNRDNVQEVISKMPSTPILNKFYRNRGDLTFADNGANWGMDSPSFSNGASYADLDNDGDLDLVVSNVNAQAFVFRNNSEVENKNHYLSIQLKGKENNTYAIGSTIKVFCGGEIISREVMPSRGFQSSIGYKVVVGLGDRKVDSLQVLWPDRSASVLRNPGWNKTLSFSWDEGEKAKWKEQNATVQQLLQLVKENIFEVHREDDYVDFYAERYLPMMQSREGPRAAVADVNNDGLEDVYIGGAAGQAGQLYLQTKNGWQRKESLDFKIFAAFEDVAAQFVDVDNDGDPDLIVGSGGNNTQPGMREMQNRLYKNDGAGNFAIDAAALPQNMGNTSTIAPQDYDGDGDIDLFIGSKCVPQNYGAAPTHYLLQNNGKGKFSDVTKSTFASTTEMHFVTDAKWADMNGDKKADLIVVGEWMPPLVFIYKNGKLKPLKTGLENYSGWWQRLAIADMDNDGNLDMIIGNMGENEFLTADSLKPMKLWFDDFDKNMTYDKILTRTVNERDMPVFMKRDFTDQLPSLKKKVLRFETYATTSIQELFSPDEIAHASKYTFNYSKSAIAYNDGKGSFHIQALPRMVQFSSVNAVQFADLNADGKLDILLAGNQFSLQPQFGRLDASYGHVLINKGNRNFLWLEPRLSGLQVEGAVRDIQYVNGAGGGFLFLRNNALPQWYATVTKTHKK